MSKKKKKKSRTLIILILLAIMCGGAYLCVHGYVSSKNETNEDSEEEETSSEVLLSETTDQVTKISYKNDKDTVVLVKEKETWKLESDKNCPIDQSKVSDMLSIFSSTEATKKIADNQENKVEYGLDYPSLSVTITLKDKSTVSYQVGIAAIGDSEGYYVSVDDKDGIYLAPVTVYSPFQYNVKQLVAIEEVPEITSDYIYGVTVKKGNETTFAIKGNDSEYVITSPYKQEVAADAEKLSTLLDSYTAYSFTENVDYAGKELSKYGLEHPAYTVEVKYYEVVEEEATEETEDSGTSTGTTTKKGDKKTFTLFVGNKEKDGNYYVQIKGSSSVYLMEESSVTTLINVDAFGVVEKAPVSIDLASVKKIIFKTEDKTYTMTVDAKAADEISDSDETEETAYNATFNGKEMDDASAASLYSKLTALEYKQEIENGKEGQNEVLSIEIEYGDKSQYSKTIVLKSFDSNYDQIISGKVSAFTVDKRVAEELISALKKM
ncbi:MAG: DUF4340 domain-containing protein [bacterium]|nr:DUF4340 domain-containing protein [bacterium]